VSLCSAGASKPTLEQVCPAGGFEASVFAGFERLCDRTLGKEWGSDDGGIGRIDRCLIDANWGASTDIVYEYCRRSPHAAMLTPSHGRS